MSLCPVLKGAKKMNQQYFVRRKKRQPITRRFTADPPLADFPVLLAKRQALRNSRSLCPAGVLRQ
jgi:hypothetical protein